jgi:hypothetical protein
MLILLQKGFKDYLSGGGVEGFISGGEGLSGSGGEGFSGVVVGISGYGQVH